MSGTSSPKSGPVPMPLEFLPPPLRGLVLTALYYAALAVMAWALVAVVLPISTFVGVGYGALTLLRVQLFGAPPGRYIDEVNLRKSDIGALQRFLVLNRSAMVLAFVLPLSRAWQFYGRLRTYITVVLESAPTEHAKRVDHIVRQFEQWRKEGGQRRIVTARPGWKRVSNKQSSYKKDCFQVHVDRMMDILEIDTQARTVRVEPMVNMGQLVPVLMDAGWTLPAVPELEELTVGGMVCGTGVESSSHHAGLFQEFCIELEIVLASGTVVKCSRHEREDLFEAYFWCYGTLGMLTSVTLRIIPCEAYVRLEYHAFDTEEAFVKRWTAESEKGVAHAERGGDDVDLDAHNGKGGARCHRFVEGLVFSRDRGVVMVGDFADKVGSDGTLYEHGKWYKPYFYRHAEDVMRQCGNGCIVEYWPLRDYYYRHSRSVFWEMENIVPLGDSALFRWGFGWMLPPSVSFLKLTTPPDLQKFYDTKHVIQDMLVPADTLTESLEVFRKNFDMYPLWVCPMTLRPNKGLVHPRGDKHELFVDLGAYGVPGAVKRGEDYDLVGRVREVEAFVAKVKGFEMLYADAYMTRAEFAEMFDRGLYDKLRKSLGADKAFPDLYDKIVEPRRLQQLRERFGDDMVK